LEHDSSEGVLHYPRNDAITPRVAMPCYSLSGVRRRRATGSGQASMPGRAQSRRSARTPADRQHTPPRGAWSSAGGWSWRGGARLTRTGLDVAVVSHRRGLACCRRSMRIAEGAPTGPLKADRTRLQTPSPSSGSSSGMRITWLIGM
jgi:hypothetical protein